MTDNSLIDQLCSPSNQAKSLINKFNQLIKEIQKTHWKEAIAEATKYFNTKLYALEKLTPNKVKELYRVLATKFYNEQKVKTSWHENELRIFVWVLITVSGLKKKKADLFETEDWDQISCLFMKKNSELCQFQYYSLKKLDEKHDKWSLDQDKMLVNILQEKQIKNKWNQIAKQIFNRSNHLYFRTAKQCRERWNNYLDPAKIKGNWTREQDLKLVRIVLTKGKKWSTIAKELNNTRTQHMVKNRYKSLLARQNKKDRKHKKYFNETLVLQEIQKKLNLFQAKEQKEIIIDKKAPQLNVKIQNQEIPQNQESIKKSVIVEIAQTNQMHQIENENNSNVKIQPKKIMPENQTIVLNNQINTMNVSESQYLFYHPLAYLYGSAFSPYNMNSFPAMQSRMNQKIENNNVIVMDPNHFNNYLNIMNFNNPM